MRLLIDENVPVTSVARLRDAGHDVATVTPGSPDRDVLDRAGRERRLLVTRDRDFGGLVFRDGMTMPSGIVLLRFPGADPGAAARVLLRLFEQPVLVWEQRFTVVHAGGVRQRAIRSLR